MSEAKVNPVHKKCPSFYKEKIKDNQKESKLIVACKKFLENIKSSKS